MDLITGGLFVGAAYLGYKLFAGGDKKKVECNDDAVNAKFQTAMYATYKPSELKNIADNLRACKADIKASQVNEMYVTVQGMSREEWLIFAGITLRNSGKAMPGETVQIRYKDTDEVVTITVPAIDTIDEANCSAADIDTLNQAVSYTVYYPAEAIEAAEQFRRCGYEDYAIAAEQKAQALTIMGDEQWLQTVAASLYYAGGTPGSTVTVANRNPGAEPAYFDVIVAG